MAWLAQQLALRGSGHVWLPPSLPPYHLHTRIRTRTNSKMHTFAAVLPGAGPENGDMWLAFASWFFGLRWQILCLSACLQMTSLEQLTKTEEEYYFAQRRPEQSPCMLLDLLSSSPLCSRLLGQLPFMISDFFFCTPSFGFVVSMSRSSWENQRRQPVQTKTHSDTH